MTNTPLRRRLSALVSSATGRANQAVASDQPAAPLPASRPSVRTRITTAVTDEGFEAAEGVIRAHEAELWGYLARIAEKTDRPRALDYALRAIEIDPQLTYVRTLVRVAGSLGIIRTTEQVLQTALEREESPPEYLLRQLKWLQVLRTLLDHGMPIPQRQSRRAFDPLPDTILYCMHNSLPHASSGYATRSHGLLHSLQNAGMTMRPYTRFGYPWDVSFRQKIVPIPDFPEQDAVDGITYHRLRTLELGWGQVSLDRYMDAFADELERVVRAERPAVIHAASNFMVGLPSVIVARRLGLPVIYEVRGLWEVTRASRDPLWKDSEHYQAYVRLETQAAGAADAVITLTAALKEELVRRGVPAERITVVPNSVDPDQFNPLPRDRDLERRFGLEGRRVVGYVGSFTQYEGLDDLLHAASVVLDRGVDLRVLLVGDGAELSRLRALVTELELDEQVIVTGRVPFADVQRYYSLIDIAAFPRKPLPVTEMVSPMKPFEAMAMGKAILVSSVGALAEIVADGETGMVFQKGDIDSLADGLERMVRDPALCERLGTNARAWVVTHRSWSRAAAAIVELYRSVERADRLPELVPVPGFPAEVWKRLRGKNDRERQSAILHYPWTGRILDIGSGRGFVSCLIAVQFQPDVLVGIEPTRRFLDQSRALAAANGVERFVGIAGRGEQLPFPPGSFDRILISEVLEHTREPGRIVREASRVLVPRGTALITVPRHGAMPPGTVAGHVQDFTVAEFRTLLDDAGLCLREHQTVASWEFYFVERPAVVAQSGADAG